MNDVSELARLQAENARLIALLDSHGIEWRSPQSVATVAREPERSRLSTAEKVALFRRLFRGRTDVYPIRWEGKTSGKAGYTPACANEWRAGVCEKPRIKCGDCSNRLLIPLSDTVIYDHLAGEHSLGGRSGCPAARRPTCPPVHRQAGWRRLRPSTARHACAGYARFLEGHATAVRWPPAPGARRQDRRSDHRLRGHRPSCVAADVG